MPCHWPQKVNECLAGAMSNNVIFHHQHNPLMADNNRPQLHIDNATWQCNNRNGPPPLPTNGDKHTHHHPQEPTTTIDKPWREPITTIHQQQWMPNTTTHQWQWVSATHQQLVFASPVQSGFLPPKQATMNCKWSKTDPDIVGTKPDHLGPVFCSPWNWFRPVHTGFFV